MHGRDTKRCAHEELAAADSARLELRELDPGQGSGGRDPALGGRVRRRFLPVWSADGPFRLDPFAKLLVFPDAD